jgi:hypothetical protein
VRLAVDEAGGAQAGAGRQGGSAHPKGAASPQDQGWAGNPTARKEGAAGDSLGVGLPGIHSTVSPLDGPPL